MKINKFSLFLISLLFIFPNLPPAAAEITKPINFLTPCISNELFCIEGISARLPDGSLIRGVETGRRRNEVLSVDDSYLKHLRGPVAEWSFPGLKFQNGTSNALLFAYYWPPDNLHCWNDGYCSTNEEEIGIYLRGSNFDSYRPPVIVTGQEASIVCPNSASTCNIGTPPWMINLEVSFEIIIRINKEFEPLYSHGRLKNLLIETEKTITSDSYKKMKVSFSPVKLQNVYFAAANPGLVEKSLYVTDEPALWIYGLKNSKSNSLGPCGKLGGLQVTSNAYYMWNPTWNLATQSIDVKLQSTHLDADGVQSKGLLQVRISTEMARCLWSVDLQGNVKASIAIDYGNGGTPEVVTLVGNLRDNFFELTAANFHFSAPTLKLKLTGDTSPNPVESISPKVEVPIVLKNSTITCTKGKVIKKVTAVNPKCPAGYKMKTLK